MKFKELTGNISFLRRENLFYRVSFVLFSATLLLAVYALSNQRPIITMQPPHLNEMATIGFNQAHPSMHKAWSRYLAETLGNITPTDAEFARSTLELILSPRVRDQVLVAMDEQVDQIKRDRVSFSFEAREVNFNSATMKTYVTGRHTTHVSPTNNPTVTRTYEFEWRFSNYMPQLVFIDTYQGSPNIPRN